MKIEHVTVVGAGTMGHGIAQVAAQAGFITTLYDISAAQVDAGLAQVTANLDKGIARGKLTPEIKDSALANLKGSVELAEAVAAADLVIEAAPERIDLKRSIFHDVERHAPAHCLMASNTSSLSIAALAKGTHAPEHMLGMHFFNPVHVMELLEIVVHAGTSPDTLARVLDIADAMGKTTIVVNDSPGFATSRLGVALGLEAMRMLEQRVASAADIDAAMELGYRHPMGPLRLTDLVGLDVRLRIAEYLHQELGSDVFEPPQILRQMVEEGRLGKKAGRGFYEWRDE